MSGIYITKKFLVIFMKYEKPKLIDLNQQSEKGHGDANCEGGSYPGWCGDGSSAHTVECDNGPSPAT